MSVVAVRPAWQRRGIAAALIHLGLARRSELGAPFVAVLGNPHYYRRFGFTTASEFGVGNVTTMDTPRYWFYAKRYGWGWGLPATWEGWSVLIAYLALVIGGVPVLQVSRGTPAYIAFVGLLTVALVRVCWVKGEPPRWRWGRRS